MNQAEFIKMISIDEEGHYPFSLYVENANNTHVYSASRYIEYV